MRTATLIATLIAGSLPSAFSLPVEHEEVSVSKRQDPGTVADGREIIHGEAPGYCGTAFVPDVYGSDWAWLDLSQNVQDDGLGDTACVSFIADDMSNCDPLGIDDQTDLRKAVSRMRQHGSSKIFANEKEGRWELMWDNVFAGGEVPIEVVTHWNHGIDLIEWGNPGTSNLIAVILNFEGTTIRAEKRCNGKW